MTTNKQHQRAIINILAQHPNGVAISELLEALSAQVGRRTLQRRLNELIATGQIIRIGKTKNAIYQLATTTDTLQTHLSLSAEAKKFKALVNQDLSLRPHVGFQAKFLEDYQPNSSHYLTNTELRHLQAFGEQEKTHLSAGTFIRTILSRFLIDLAWNSSRLEGNTYSLLETERLLFNHQASANKSPLETQMIINHKAAIEFIVESIAEVDFNRMTICNLHALLSNNLLGDPSASGRLRSIPVGIHKTHYQPLAIPQLIEDYFNLILKKLRLIRNPFEQALFALVHLPYLQPFEDVNKRVARLSANIPLIKHNLCPLSFVDLSNKDYIDGMLAVYEYNNIAYLKAVFIWAYERSTRRYAAIQKITQPDPLRLRYRDAIYQLIKKIVVEKHAKTAAIDLIRQYAQRHIKPNDQARFIEIIETELQSLHSGNFARYGVNAQQFKSWQAGW